MSTNLLASCANCVIESFKGVKTLIFTLYLVAYNIFSLLHCLREDIFSAVISLITLSRMPFALISAKDSLIDSVLNVSAGRV